MSDMRLIETSKDGERSERILDSEVEYSTVLREQFGIVHLQVGKGACPRTAAALNIHQLPEREKRSGSETLVSRCGVEQKVG